jgi:hypothetical protein
MNQAGRRTGGELLVTADNGAAFVDFDRMPTANGSFLMALEVSLMGNAAVVDEPLRTREVPSVTIDANELDGETVGSFENAARLLIFRLGVSTR